MSAAAPAASHGRRIISTLVSISDIVAAAMLAADLFVVCVSVLARFLFNAPVEWADDVARGLMVGSSFFGAASALARGENPGAAFSSICWRRVCGAVDPAGALLVTIISGWVANALEDGWPTTGQTSGSGLPLEWTFYPMGAGALFMAICAGDFYLACAGRHRRHRRHRRVAAIWWTWDFLSPATVPRRRCDAGRFFLTLFGGLPRERWRWRADLHLGGGHAARRHLRPADGAASTPPCCWRSCFSSSSAT
jgi:TRAP-type C4-dicarboxylate transport system permease small subunit